MKISEKIIKDNANEALSKKDVKIYKSVFDAVNNLEKKLILASKQAGSDEHKKAYKSVADDFLEWQENDKGAYSDAMMGIEMDLDDDDLL